MKILLLSDYYQPKMAYAKVKIAQNLQQLGHEVKVLTSDRYFPFHNYQETCSQILGKRIRAIGEKIEASILVERKKTIWEIFTRVFFADLEKSVRQYQPELVICVGISSPSAIRIALLKKSLPFRLLMVDSHLPSELERGNKFLKKIFYFLFRFFFASLVANNTDQFIALQDKTQEIIKHTYGIKSKNIKIIPNGTDIDLFKFNLIARNKIRHQFKIKKKDFVIIYTGKIIKEKGIDILFKAFNFLNKKNIYLLLVGDGPSDYKNFCLKLVNLKLHGNIIWAGWQKQETLPAYYSAADVAVWPLQESLAMNDAASCGLPFIANHELGDKTRVSEHNALLYKKGSYLDLAQKITYLLKNYKIRSMMGRRGRRLAEEKLSWYQIAQAYL